MVKKTKTNQRYLIWCWAFHGEEAWFEVATNKKTARQNFANGVGCEMFNVKSKLVCEITRNPSIRTGDTVTLEYLKELGFEVVSENTPSIVRYNGQIYREGSFFEKFLETKEYSMFPCVYFFKILETDRYKIGSTGNLMARKQRLESQQAHHIHISNFIETEENEEVERFLKRFFEKFKIKGDEWFRMDDFIIANVEIAFEIIKTEMQIEPTFKYRSELFELLTDQLKEIINEHKPGTEPLKELIEKLNIIYELNLKRKVRLSHKVKPEEIIKLWSEHKEKKDELEFLYLKKFCPFKLGDIITDDYQNKYKVEGREVYFYEKDKTARFYYSGTQLLKNGKEGKRFHNFISVKDRFGD